MIKDIESRLGRLKQLNENSEIIRANLSDIHRQKMLQIANVDVEIRDMLRQLDEMVTVFPEMLEALKTVREHVMILGGLPMDIHNKVCNAIEKAGGNDND